MNTQPEALSAYVTTLPEAIGVIDRLQAENEVLKAQRDGLLGALGRILSTVPALQDGGGFVVDHHSPDGEYIGSQNIDPMWVVQEMATVAMNAIASVKDAA